MCVCVCACEHVLDIPVINHPELINPFTLDILLPKYESLTGLVDKLKSGDKKTKQEFQQILTVILVPALNEKKGIV